MIGINQVMFYGRLAADPEFKTLANGDKVSRLLLVNDRKYSGADGEQKSESTFIRVDFWDKKAELCRKALRKGGRVFIFGSLVNDKYVSKIDGAQKNELKVRANDIRIVDYAEDADFREESAE